MKQREKLPLDLPELGRDQRLDTVHRTLGFIPTSYGELTEAMGLQSFSPSIGGAAKHLAEVIRHQNKADTSDPQAAGRRLVRDYINYARDARGSRASLLSLQGVLREVLNPKLTLDVVVEPSEVGLLEYLRHTNLHTLRLTGDINQVGYDPMKVNYDASNAGILHYLGEALPGWQVHQVRTGLSGAIEEQGARYEFFEARLGEVGRHTFGAIGAIAVEGLEQLQGIPQLQ